MPEVHLPHLEDEEPQEHAPDEQAKGEPPAPQHSRRRSMLKLGLEVVLISTGVFLGLIGEQWRQSTEHRELAQQSLQRFRAEFRANNAEVERVHDRHVREYEGLKRYFADHQTEL